MMRTGESGGHSGRVVVAVNRVVVEDGGYRLVVDVEVEVEVLDVEVDVELDDEVEVDVLEVEVDVDVDVLVEVEVDVELVEVEVLVDVEVDVLDVLDVVVKENVEVDVLVEVEVEVEVEVLVDVEVEVDVLVDVDVLVELVEVEVDVLVEVEVEVLVDVLDVVVNDCVDVLVLVLVEVDVELVEVEVEVVVEVVVVVVVVVAAAGAVGIQSRPLGSLNRRRNTPRGISHRPNDSNQFLNVQGSAHRQRVRWGRHELHHEDPAIRLAHLPAHFRGEDECQSSADIEGIGVQVDRGSGGSDGRVVHFRRKSGRRIDWVENGWRWGGPAGTGRGEPPDDFVAQDFLGRIPHVRRLRQKQGMDRQWLVIRRGDFKKVLNGGDRHSFELNRIHSSHGYLPINPRML